MDPESIEKYTALAKQLNIPKRLISFIPCTRRSVRNVGCSMNRRREISWRKIRD